MIDNPDGSVTITIDEISAVSGINKHLTSLSVRARAYRPDPSCAIPLHEMASEWKALCSRIVTENGPSARVTIQPAEIPEGTTLLLVAQRVVPGRTDVFLTLVGDLPPTCVGSVFSLATPPSAVTSASPRWR